MNLNQQCWNHEEREAACRCPACGRSYCRECVSEHEGRLLCAACLSRITANRPPETRTLRKLAPPAMIAAGILLAWLVYWAAGAALIGLVHRLRNTASTRPCTTGLLACRPVTRKNSTLRQSAFVAPAFLPPVLFEATWHTRNPHSSRITPASARKGANA